MATKPDPQDKISCRNKVIMQGIASAIAVCLLLHLLWYWVLLSGLLLSEFSCHILNDCLRELVGCCGALACCFQYCALLCTGSLLLPTGPLFIAMATVTVLAALPLSYERWFKIYLGSDSAPEATHNKVYYGVRFIVHFVQEVLGAGGAANYFMIGLLPLVGVAASAVCIHAVVLSVAAVFLLRFLYRQIRAYQSSDDKLPEEPRLFQCGATLVLNVLGTGGAAYWLLMGTGFAATMSLGPVIPVVLIALLCGARLLERTAEACERLSTSCSS